MSRSEKSIKNLSTAIIGQGVGVVISFVTRIFFLKLLGSEYLGLNGLFVNILSVLSLAELGVGEAITYSLYKPLAKKDITKCQMLMQLYKKVYTIIGLVIIILGLMITPFLSFLIKEMPNVSGINIIFILFVLNTAISYFFSYKRNLIIADQKRYIATIYRYVFYAVLNIIQIVYLAINKDYIGYLIIQIIMTILENVLVSIKADKMYPYLKERKKVSLDKETKAEIIKNTKAMMMHKVGGIVVSSTDNILISKFIGIIEVGIYSNYYLIINALNIVYAQLYSSIVASIGNLCIEGNKEEEYLVFKRIDFLGFWIYSFSSICLASLLNPFIEIWVGSQYLFPFYVVLMITINFYIYGMRKVNLTFKEATGLFYKDRWKAIIEVVVNLIISIILVKKLGVFGVFLGTFISSVTVCVWVEPYILFKYIFNKSLKEYFIYYFKYMLVTVLIGTIIFILNLFVSFKNLVINFLVKSIISVIGSNLLLLLLFYKSDKFQYFYAIFKKYLRKIKEDIKKKNLYEI